MKVLSIDIGIRNFAMSLYCTNEKKFILFVVKDLIKIKDCVARMKQLTAEEPFLSADVILVENQMRSVMRTMATSIRAFHFNKTIMIAPQSVKRFFSSGTKKHSSNKKVAVNLARGFLKKKNLAEFEAFRKKDDIADCVLQTIYYLKKILPSRCVVQVSTL